MVKALRWMRHCAILLQVSCALATAQTFPQDWHTTGNDTGEQHFSPLTQINAGSISRLGFAWEYPVANHQGSVQYPLEATPIVVDGVMFTSGAWGAVYALKAATGELLWKFAPEVDASRARLGCCQPVNRGVAFAAGTIYVGQFDGWLVALDAMTGAVRWKVDTIIDRKRGYSITGVPRIVGDKVVIGNGGNELGIRGYITAYDLKSGGLRWRFFTVPGSPKQPREQADLDMAARTWDPKTNWDAGGGGAAWDGMVYDPAANLLYVGTGNGAPTPAWLRGSKTADNLFLSSILAISPDNGRLVWYYQVTPGDSWDFDATQPMILSTLTISGHVRSTLIQASKNGFIYVLDRLTGELLSAEQFVTVTWASRVDMGTGRPVLTARADYQREPKVIYPTSGGGHNWQPTAFSPITGLVYIPALDFPMKFSTHPGWKYHLNDFNWGASYEIARGDGTETVAQTAGKMKIDRVLVAWDPVRKRKVWETSGGGGVLATAGGLVFEGLSSGYLQVRRARDGHLERQIFVGSVIGAAPMSYAVNGAQYVAVMVGGGQYLPQNENTYYSDRGRILVFRLDGGHTPLPDLVPSQVLNALPPRTESAPLVLVRGEKLYMAHCVWCHGAGDDVAGQAPTQYPNLFNLQVGFHDVFDDIVLRGLLSHSGMARFDDLLNADDVHAIHGWIIDEAYRLRTTESATALNRHSDRAGTRTGRE